jgi:hypothetical protein
MGWDWGRVNPSGLPARLAMAVTVSMVLAGLGTLLAALKSAGVLLVACLAVTALTWTVAAAYISLAAGWIRRR